MRRRLAAFGGFALVLALSARAGGAQPATGLAGLIPLEQAAARNPDDLFAAADYRQAAIRCGAFDRSIEFFKRLVKAHPRSAPARLNLALAYVDKIPTSGDLRQALLGREAIGELGRANAIEPTWVGHYTRGFIYLNYPRAFGGGPKAVAEFERAIALSASEPPRPHHARAWVALGDAQYWRLSDLGKARTIWAEGARRFPQDEALRERLSKEGMPLRDAIRKTMSPDTRVDTSLVELRPAERAEDRAGTEARPH